MKKHQTYLAVLILKTKEDHFNPENESRFCELQKAVTDESIS